jgi:hypothetical protein
MVSASTRKRSPLSVRTNATTRNTRRRRSAQFADRNLQASTVTPELLATAIQLGSHHFPLGDRLNVRCTCKYLKEVADKTLTSAQFRRGGWFPCRSPDLDSIQPPCRFLKTGDAWSFEFLQDIRITTNICERDIDALVCTDIAFPRLQRASFDLKGDSDVVHVMALATKVSSAPKLTQLRFGVHLTWSWADISMFCCVTSWPALKVWTVDCRRASNNCYDGVSRGEKKYYPRVANVQYYLTEDGILDRAMPVLEVLNLEHVRNLPTMLFASTMEKLHTFCWEQPAAFPGRTCYFDDLGRLPWLKRLHTLRIKATNEGKLRVVELMKLLRGVSSLRHLTLSCSRGKLHREERQLYHQFKYGGSRYGPATTALQAGLTPCLPSLPLLESLELFSDGSQLLHTIQGLPLPRSLKRLTISTLSGKGGCPDLDMASVMHDLVLDCLPELCLEDCPSLEELRLHINIHILCEGQVYGCIDNYYRLGRLLPKLKVFEFTEFRDGWGLSNALKQQDPDWNWSAIEEHGVYFPCSDKFVTGMGEAFAELQGASPLRRCVLGPVMGKARSALSSAFSRYRKANRLPDLDELHYMRK